MTTLNELSIQTPDDWHLHVRDGAAMAAVLPYTARQFGRAIIMPNLRPPITTTAQAVAYRERLLAALPEGSTFEPLMTLYLTDNLPPDEIRRAKDAGIAVGGGPGRVELERHHASVARPGDLVGRGVVGEVERHQRREVAAGRPRREDAVAVGQRLRGGGDRRAQVGHDDRAAELPRGVRHHGGHRGAIAHMQVPVVGTGEGERLQGHAAILSPARPAHLRRVWPAPSAG